MQKAFEDSVGMDMSRVFALRLHVLNPEDREWVISRLDPLAKAKLLPLVQELDELGIELSIADIEAIENQSNTSKASINEAGLEMEIASIDAASISQLEMIFDREPAVFFDYLCAMRRWSWLDDIEQQSSKLKFRKSSKQSNGIDKLTDKVIVEFIKYISSQLTKPTIESANTAVKRNSDNKKPLIQLLINKIRP